MSKRFSILVVEDEPNIRNILEYNLKSDGFEVTLAEDGVVGLELARDKKPDVILLDWRMPEMDGLEVLNELKSDMQTKNISVFMLTAKKMACHIRTAMVEGVDGYFTKPFDPKQLGQKITRMLETSVIKKGD